MDIDISNPPEFDVAPVELYTTVMPDDEEFAIEAYDIGVYEEIKKDAPLPTPRAPQKRRAKRQEVVAGTEVIEPMLSIPDELMDTVIGRLAEVTAECLEFPEASVFMALLSTASSIVSTAYAVQYDTGKSVALGLYTVIEQPPATKKSWLLGIGLDPYKKGMSAHNRRVAGRIREFVERDQKPPASLLPGFYYTTDPTSAGMDSHLAVCSEGRFVVASAEQSAFSSLFPDGAFPSNNELLLKGWAGEDVAGMRTTRKAYEGVAQGSITLVAQPGSSRRVLNASGGSGLAERFIFICEPDLLGFRKHEGIRVSNEDQAEYRKAAQSCIDIYSNNILSFANSEERIIYDPDNLIQLRPTERGQLEFLLRARKNEPRMQALKESGDMVTLSWIGKFETFALKVAAIIHVFECHASGCKVPEIIPDSLIFSSMDLIDVLGDHVQQLIRDAGESGVDAEESAVISVLDRPMVMRSLRDKLRGRKPFRSMPGSGYKAITARVESMLKQGSLVIGTDGKISVM